MYMLKQWHSTFQLYGLDEWHWAHLQAGFSMESICGSDLATGLAMHAGPIPSIRFPDLYMGETHGLDDMALQVRYGLQAIG